MAVSGTHAYVADGTSGVQMIDIADPASPQIVGSVNTPGVAFDAACSGSHAYVADYCSLQVVDVANPASPRIVGSMTLPEGAQGVAVSPAHVHVATGSDGFQMLPTQCEPMADVETDGLAASKLRFSACPNPSSGWTAIHLEIPSADRVVVGVYDAGGRLVRWLCDEIFSAGHHGLAWDGLDQKGRAVPAGVYLIRVSTRQGNTTVRFVEVR